MPRSARALLLALCALAAHAPPARAQRAPRPDTATYASPPLAALVAAAARDNRVPPELLGYRAAVESEVAVALRRDDGSEATVGVEQIASTLRWTRDGAYDQHIVGYRARQAAPTMSMLTALRSGWVVPVLYGQRLFAPRDPGRDSVGRRRASSGRREAPLVAVHPFARDRERYYRFSGGDTVVTLRTAGVGGARAVPIVRVHVEPRAGAARRDQLLFLGDVDLDATRHVVVRLRGRYVVPTSTLGGVRGRIARAALQAYAFVEYETAEREGAFWLPTYQRVEFQGVVPLLGDARAVVRIVSRVRDVAVNDTAAAALAIADARWRLTRAGGDSIDRFDAWRAPLGGTAATLHADDFDDVAPEPWRRIGAPRVELYAARTSDFVHFDRVEGLFTGAGGRVRFRDAAPGLTVRAALGWAWAEGTARGRVELEQEWLDRRAAGGEDASATVGRWTATLRAYRALDLTNDFRDPLDSGSSLGALLGSIDDYDYVDRQGSALALRRATAGRAAELRVESGIARDAVTAAHVTRGLTGRDPFRPNRGVAPGTYARTTITATLHPDVAAEFVRPGVGARLAYERGDGGLAYQRLELRLVGRVELPMPWPGALHGSTLTAIARGDAGLVTGDTLPPQQLFELGGTMSLRGYPYKAFAGDEAALVRGALVYGSPWLRAPIRIGRVVLPGLAPGASIGVETGATAARTAAAHLAIARLGGTAESPVSRPSDGPRTTLDVGLRFFGGALFLGGARAIDRHADRPDGWRVGVGTGVSF